MKLAKRTQKPTSLDMLRREMDHFFDDLAPFSWSRENGGNEAAWSPSTDIAEDENEYVIHLEIPGMDKEDIKVNYQDGRLTITGERKGLEKEDKKDFIRRERYYGSFYRAFTFPEKVVDEEINASFKDGVLILNVPKTETVKPKMIEVK